MNGYNLFLSRNVGNLDGEGKVVDYAKVVVCQGDLTVPSWAKAEEKAPGVLEVSWDKDAPGEYEYNDYCRWWCIAIGESRNGGSRWMISTGRNARTDVRSGASRRG